MLGRSMLAYLPVNFVNILTSFGTIVILTRLLDAAEFGRYAIAMITLQFVHSLLFTWIEAAAARYQAEAEKNDTVASHLTTLYRLALWTVVIGASLCLIIISILPISTTMKTVLMFAIISTSLQLFFNLGMESHRASHRIMRYSMTYSSMNLISFTAGILFVLFTPLAESGPFVGIIFGLMIVGTLDFIFMRTQMKGGHFQTDKSKDYFKYGVPICIGLLFAYALNSIDIYLIAFFMGDASAGEYNAGYNLANRSLETLFVWISMAVTPIAITAIEQSGESKSREVMHQYGSALMWIAFPATVGVALVSRDAGFILGESVRDNAVTIMPWIAAAGLINGMMSYYIQRAFMLSKKSSNFIWALIPPVILNIGLNIWLIPQFGLMGAVSSTLICYALAFIIATILARRDYPLPLPIRSGFEIGVCCLLMAAAIMALPIPESWIGPVSLIIKSAVGIFVYVTACLAINAANCREAARFVQGYLSNKNIPLASGVSR